MEFLSEKAKSHLSKETMGKPTEAAPVSPPRQDRVIHVISGGSEISGINHAAAKKSTWNAKHGLEAAMPKRLLLGTDEISFTAKEKERVLTPHHDALVISLTIANCLVKRILIDNGAFNNIIFQAAYKDLGLEEGALTRRITPFIEERPRSHSNYRANLRPSHRGTGANLEEPPSEEVYTVEEGETWMTPLIRYLEADILLEDRSEARKIKTQATRYCISQDKLYRRSFSGPYLSVGPNFGQYINGPRSKIWAVRN
ncbi:hypothetical protein DY000_02031780 [Brassica cretica]|uniref:Aspartic peptidase DDI1-type domain-containing protein n=1 Tax=Brassica cretica TaxID=69181 RepID=A0ABQ7DHP6_BRACR|nr:hypothetical protein DY000_02031780 [Brassica cretica]